MSVRESRNLRASGRGVLIYWHVERKSMAIHSQLIGCPASEVAAMIEGVMRHGAVMEVEASSIGFTGVTANGKSMDTLNPVQITMPDTSVAGHGQRRKLLRELHRDRLRAVVRPLGSVSPPAAR